MLKIYLRAGLRSLLRHRSFSLINLIGLTLGFSAIMVMSVMLYQYLTANGQFEHKDRMYYVKLRQTDGSSFMYTPYPYLGAIAQSCPDVEAATHLQQSNSPWLRVGKKEFQGDTWFVDSGFFRVFSYPLEYGDARQALSGASGVVLSHEMAAKLFGSAGDAIGKTLTRSDSIPMTVTGVLQPVPTNTTTRPEVLLSTEVLARDPNFMSNANWYNCFSNCYLMVRPGADTAKLNRQLKQLAQTHFDKNMPPMTPFLAPYSHFVEAEAGNLVSVLTKGLTGSILFVLLIVVANLINLNAATLLDRQKEMAVRKMVGSSRLHLVVQFVLENMIMIFAGLFFAFLFFRGFLMPAINEIIRDQFGAIALNIRHDYPLIGLFVLVGLLIVVLAGSFPAIHFGSLRALDAIKGRISTRRERNTTRNTFITLQFVLATTFIGIALIFNSQMRHMKGAVLGFQKDNILVAHVALSFRDQDVAASRYDALLNDLRHNPAVLAFSNSHSIPTGYDNNFNTFVDPATNTEVSMRQGGIDNGMIPTYQIKLLAGENYRGTNDSADRNTVIINRRAVALMGWGDPAKAIGRQLRPKGDNATMTVVGVMDDFHYGNLSNNIDPLLLWPMGRQKLMSDHLSIRFAAGHEKEIGQLLVSAFKEMPSRQDLSYELLSSRIDEQYSLLEGILKATSYIALMTVFIATMGLFGLIAAFTRRRVKEVGIRKVLGAGMGDIVVLLSRSFLLLIGIALAIALPVAWIVMHNWLQDFAYRIDIQWWMLGGAGFIALVIAGATVGWHAIRAAKANPVTALRSE